MGDPITISEEERQALRDSVRGFLESRWPVDDAVERSQDGDAVRKIWGLLAQQGLTTLGTDPEEAGLREILLVFEELGRASCPAPMLGAVAANLLLAGSVHSNQVVRDRLDGLRSGTETVAIALAGFDGDAAAGRIVYANGLLSGRTQFVESADIASSLIVLIDEPVGAVIVPADAAGLSIKATPGLAIPALSEINFSTRPAAFIELTGSQLSDVALVMRLACAARALGAAQRAFDLALEHAKLRRQFGQLIGQFQAIQHKLADCLTRLDGTRLVIEDAAATYDCGDDAWRVFAAAGLAFAGHALRQVVFDAHHTLGAIGYAEEHEAPRHFKRVHADIVRFGGAGRARAELADYLLGSTSHA